MKNTDPKDYSLWHSAKARINSDKIRPMFHEREIWFCSVGENIGFEQNGHGENYLRPSVIIRKFNNQVCLIIPLTSSFKEGIHYFNFTHKEIKNSAILSQIRLIDAKRLEYLSGYMKKEDFSSLKEKLKRLIA